MPTIIQWGDAECDMLVEERLRRNQEYHNRTPDNYNKGHM